MSQLKKKSTAKKNPNLLRKKGASTSTPPLHFDKKRFQDKEKEERFFILINWVFVPERRVEMKRGEYPEFQEPLQQIKWTNLATPHGQFDPEVVQEFYANAWRDEKKGQERDYKSWVSGREINFDRDTINNLIGKPYEPRQKDALSPYHVMAYNSEFDDTETAAKLCIPGRTYGTNKAGEPMRIYRKHMNQLAQTWMLFFLHNVRPCSHVSSLPLRDCHLLSCILDGIDIDVADIIANEIHEIATKKVLNGTLGLPSLITTLCESQGVEVNRTEKIKLPITKQYILQNCKEEIPDQPQPQQQQPVPPQQQQQQHLSMRQQMARLTLHMEHVELQNEILRQGQMHLHQGLYTAYQWQQPGNEYWMNPLEFSEKYPWHGVRPVFPGEEGADGAGGPSGTAGEDGDGDETADQEGDDEELLHDMETDEQFNPFGDM